MTLYAPAKTFFIGEYVATVGGPSIVLATQPAFSLIIDETVSGLVNIHPDSPAGQWYEHQQDKPGGLVFTDPYQGIGGLGASSAQFVLVYQAVKNWQKQTINTHFLLSDYYLYAWNGNGIRPSGYDVLTQYAGQSLFIDEFGEKQIALNWSFLDHCLALVHTGNKLATHLHLAEQPQPSTIDLKPIVSKALTAWQHTDINGLVGAIQDYQRQLDKQKLIAPHTAYLIKHLLQQPGVLAAKGCGAMGADVLLLIIENKVLDRVRDSIQKMNLTWLMEIDI